MNNPTAAMIVIGDEILSGRTRDSNMHYLAKELVKIGIGLQEVRIVSDVENKIIFAVNEEVKTLSCKKESKRGCGGRSVKCITHNLWDDLEKHINGFFESKNLNDLVSKQENFF